MAPSQIAARLRQVSMKLRASESPDRSLVAAELRQILAALEGESAPGGASQWFRPTAELVELAKSWLTELGFTNVQSSKRWDDDVEMVYGDGSRDLGEHNGWNLDVSGSDIEGFDPGISLTLVGIVEGDDPTFEVSSKEDVRKILEEHDLMPQAPAPPA